MNHLSRIVLFACGAVIGTSALSAGVIFNIAPGLNLAEGAGFNGAVATFTDTDPAQPASNFSAVINWGDGTMTAGTITSGNGSFSISGNHIYADESSFTASVNLTDTDGESASASGTANVADAPLNPISNLPSFSFMPGVPVSVTFGSFGDGNQFGVASDFTATINWGDGTLSAGTISGNASAFQILGGHTYANSGTFFASVNILDEGGSQVAFRTEAVGAVPEPSSLAMIVLGLGSVGFMARRKRANPRS